MIFGRYNPSGRNKNALYHRIVYSTCTINKDENERQIDKFISANENFRLVKQNCPVAGAKNIGEKVTFLPGFTEYDGFFVAVLEKVW